MTKSYDKYYNQPDYFGDPYPELIEFFKSQPSGKVLDLGCGQGRNALPLARMGFHVTGIDSSKVGIAQMTETGKKEKLNITGLVGDIYKCDYKDFDYLLLDSMFHFLKKDRDKETALVKKVIRKSNLGTIITFCIRDSGQKVNILNDSIDNDNKLKRIVDKKIIYKFNFDGQNSESKYRIIAVKK